MNGGGRITGLIFFLARFLVLAGLLVAAWWSLLPYYGQLLTQVTGITARLALGVPITGVAVEAKGLLNTETLILFQLTEHDTHVVERKMPIALLVTNLVPYLALVLATSGLGLARRLRVLALGTGIIVAGHCLFITLLLAFQEQLKAYSEVPTATIQFFLALPFLLWIWFVYSDRIGAYLAEEGAESPEEQDDTAPSSGKGEGSTDVRP